MSRADQYNVTVSIDGLGANGAAKDTGTWDKLSGGEIDSEETKYRPGNMGDEVTLGGFQTVGNITVSRLFSQSRDLPDLAKLMQLAGKADVTITKTSKNVNKVALGDPLVYKGKLKRVSPPEVDSESSDAALIEIEITSASVS